MPAPDPARAVERAVAAATRALSGQADLEIRYVRRAPVTIENSAELVLPPEPCSRQALARLRGDADAIAMRLRFHDPRLHALHRPRGGQAAVLFDAAEQWRVQALGARQYPGAARNLEARAREACADWAEDASPGLLIGLLVRERITGRALWQEPPPFENWRERLERNAEAELARLTSCVGEQEAFATFIRAIIGRLGLADEGEDGQPQPAARYRDRFREGDAGADGPAPPLRRVPAHRSRSSWRDEADAQSRAVPDPAPSEAAPYRVFTTQFDEVLEAGQLSDRGELERLRMSLDRQLEPLRGSIQRLARSLQRRVMARQMRRWHFDQEEGLLDSGRLARVIASPARPLPFKIESECEFPDTAVTLLVDNSGSMRGVPITIAAMCADILARTLEHCGVRVEILGFTTKAWKGGQSYRRWNAEGRPGAAGRLNDLLHIVYKSADTPWRRARRNLGLMLRPDLLKENIDGEALLWAYRRLLARPEERRILVVISDGAPLDDSTVAVNGVGYLERHLREVIRAIQTASDVELAAVGIGHDVTRYCRRAVMVGSAQELGAALIEQIGALFEEAPRPSPPALSR